MNGESSYHRFINGDNTAIGEIVEQYNKSLVFYLAGILGSISLAEDAAADAFVKLFVKKPRLKDSAAFRAYLYQVGRNCATDMLRKLSRRGELALDAGADLADSLSLEAELLKSERDRCLHKAMTELKAEYRQVLHLLYFEDMDYKSAGKAMDKSLKQISNLAHRAKNALKTKLLEKGFDYEI